MNDNTHADTLITYAEHLQLTEALVTERDRFEVALMIACADAVGPEVGADKMMAEYDRLLALAAERELS